MGNIWKIGNIEGNIVNELDVIYTCHAVRDAIESEDRNMIQFAEHTACLCGSTIFNSMSTEATIYIYIDG